MASALLRRPCGLRDDGAVSTNWNHDSQTAPTTPHPARGWFVNPARWIKTPHARLVANLHLRRRRMAGWATPRSSARAPMASGWASSVFDGARAFDGVTPDLDKHCARLGRSAISMCLKPTPALANVRFVDPPGAVGWF